MGSLHQLGSLLFRVVLANLSHSPTLSKTEAAALHNCLLYTKTLMNLLGHSPEFTERAFRHEYLPLLTSFFPFPGAPPHAAEGARATLLAHIAIATMGAFDNFLDTPAKAKNVLRSGAAVGLVPWLTRFVGLLTALLKQFAGQPQVLLDAQVTARSLLFLLNLLCNEAKELSPDLLKGAEFEALHKSVKDVKPLLDDAGKGNAELFLGKVRHVIQTDKHGPPVLEPSDTERVVRGLEAVRLAGGPSAPIDLRDELLLSLLMLLPGDFKKLLKQAPNVIPVLRDALVADVSRAAKKPRSSDARAQERCGTRRRVFARSWRSGLTSKCSRPLCSTTWAPQS